jgi:predicted metal-binding protein
MRTNGDLRELMDLAVALGATEAVVVEPSSIVVREELAAMCERPRCEAFGLSPLCPPHVSGPARFREMTAGSEAAIVFRLDVPTEILLGGRPRDVMALLQEISATLEERAVEMGWTGSRGFAGGSCFRIFCQKEGDCPPLDGTGPCRHPHAARPSLSGYGVDVGRLMSLAGLRGARAGRDADPALQPTSPLVGLVLLAG